MNLNNVKENDIDLYRILEIPIESSSKLSSVTESLIKKQFKSLSLDYHPDKSTQRNTQENSRHWHDLHSAYQILLSDKEEYDKWYSYRFLRGNRELLEKLELQERKASFTKTL